MASDDTAHQSFWQARAASIRGSLLFTKLALKVGHSNMARYLDNSHSKMLHFQRQTSKIVMMFFYKMPFKMLAFLGEIHTWVPNHPLCSQWEQKRLFNYKKKRIFKHIENFASKNWKFSEKFCSYIGCRYLLEPPWRGGSNEYPQFMFLSRNKSK